MIEVYKILHGLDSVDCLELDNNKSCSTRGHDYKLKKKRFNQNVGQWCFSNRVVNEWNMLSSKVVDSDSLNSFKANLDQYSGNVGGLYKL